jgi:hypothetical protein
MKIIGQPLIMFLVNDLVATIAQTAFINLIDYQPAAGADFTCCGINVDTQIISFVFPYTRGFDVEFGNDEYLFQINIDTFEQFLIFALRIKRDLCIQTLPDRLLISFDF